MTIIGGSCNKYHFCRDKHTFVASKHVFCLDKSMLVATNSFCPDKYTFVATKDVFCRDKHMFVATKHLSRQNLYLWQLRPMIRDSYCTPSLAFRHLPPYSSRTGYATEGALFISMRLSTEAVSALRKVWVLIRLWKQHIIIASKHACEHGARPPWVKTKNVPSRFRRFGLICPGVRLVGVIKETLV